MTVLPVTAGKINSRCAGLTLLFVKPRWVARCSHHAVSFSAGRDNRPFSEHLRAAWTAGIVSILAIIAAPSSATAAPADTRRSCQPGQHRQASSAFRSGPRTACTRRSRILIRRSALLGVLLRAPGAGKVFVQGDSIATLRRDLDPGDPGWSALPGARWPGRGLPAYRDVVVRTTSVPGAASPW